ncbi:MULTISPECIES: hypothetical protein [Arthrobacter]|uniref:Uncharacterized protein n=1 Tax=Arthrobacter terricola TaxID=2547396 RepID=A0A4R5K632_9MICC|nr:MULTISPECIES: hypothetical protein [Arthrobacter]MBT8163074.1 hypothetical protein [Arthrobacter sp. GN70]TDF88114.1 hypothetical protein E1809_24145 [Arthrobacter terricola]
MEPIQIIITIALCIGALATLVFIIWLIAALFLMSKAKKAAREIGFTFHDAPFDRRDYPKMPLR